jgi:hypothetical protein
MTVKGQYLRSEKFEVVDTIGVPHPYCITPQHLVHGSEHSVESWASQPSNAPRSTGLDAA